MKDLQTGAETAVFDRLDKDLQEAWTVHGVYPQYAWMPDNRQSSSGARGKIWKVDVAREERRRDSLHRAT